jgi:hypothetical protein
MTAQTPFDSSDEEGPLDDEIVGLFKDLFISKQCAFINTIGIQCPDTSQGYYECCQRHRCTYMRGGKQCGKVVTYQHQWYCVDHGKICRCQHINEVNQQCTNTIYYYSYKTGCLYCGLHQCRFLGCFQPTGTNHRQLCSDHYEHLQFCEYVNDKGEKCTNIIENPFEEIYSPSQMVQEDSEFNAKIREFIILGMKFSTHFCTSHVCQIKGCQKRIRNDTTPWCINHSVPCQYIDSDGKHCHQFYHNIQTDNIYCSEHQCHWNISVFDDQRCTKSVTIHDDSREYCSVHYQQYIFHKYEYLS